MTQQSELPILVVDLDGTLIRTDMLFESFWASVSSDSRTLYLTLKSLCMGRAALKAHLAASVAIDSASLPYKIAVLDIIRNWREQGGRVALVTAADRQAAEAIANHLGLFDEVHASDGVRNLKGRAKAEFLVSRFGAGNFDYIGDARADLPVWECARRAVTVDASAPLRKAVEAISSDFRHLQTEQRKWATYLKALRPHQWLKNTLVFLPAVAAQSGSVEIWTNSVLAFIAFSLIASSVYILNDLADLSADRAHPRKRNRPFASGAVPLSHGAVMSFGLWLAGILTALAIGRPEFLVLLFGYYALTVAYSFSLKRRLMIDIFLLASFYSLRVLAGGIASGLVLSEWLLAFSIFIFLSLAALKRQAELTDGVATGRAQATGRAYHVDDLPIVTMMAIGSGYVSVLIMALYISTPMVQSHYNTPQALWGICLVLLYWVSHMVMTAHRGNMDDDPIVFAMRDLASQVCSLLIVGIVLTASFL